MWSRDLGCNNWRMGACRNCLFIQSCKRHDDVTHTELEISPSMSSFFIPLSKHFLRRHFLQYDLDSTVTSHLPSHRPRISWSSKSKCFKSGASTCSMLHILPQDIPYIITKCFTVEVSPLPFHHRILHPKCIVGHLAPDQFMWVSYFVLSFNNAISDIFYFCSTLLNNKNLWPSVCLDCHFKVKSRSNGGGHLSSGQVSHGEPFEYRARQMTYMYNSKLDCKG